MLSSPSEWLGLFPSHGFCCRRKANGVLFDGSFRSACSSCISYFFCTRPIGEPKWQQLLTPVSRLITRDQHHLFHNIVYVGYCVHVCACGHVWNSDVRSRHSRCT